MLGISFCICGGEFGVFGFCASIFGVSNVVLGNLEPVCSGSLAMSVVRNNIKVNVSLRGRLWRLN